MITSLAVGCGDGDDESDPDASRAADAMPEPDAAPPGLEWAPCDDEPEDDCATILVPRHHDEPMGEQIELLLVRVFRPEPEQRIGTIIAYFGGTGSAIETLRRNRSLLWLVPDVAQRFDVVAFDRRGARYAAAFSCVDEAWVERSRALPAVPGDDAEWAAVDALYRDYVAACAADYAPAGWLDSEQVAHDLELVRQALREPELTMITHSYMTLAVALYARLYPDRIRAVAVDGLAPRPATDAADWFLTRAEAREVALGEVFEHCAADSSCAFHGGTSAGEIAAAYDALAAQLRATPMAVDGRLLRERDLVEAMGLMISHAPPLSTTFDPVVDSIATALAAAEAGDGSLLLSNADIATLRREDGTYDLERISQRGGLLLSDQVCPPDFDLAAARSLWGEIAAVAPRLGSSLMERVLVCLHASGRSEPHDVSAPGAPALFLGAGIHDETCSADCTNDYATALGNDSHVVLYDGYGSSPWVAHSACYRETIQQFLIDPEAWSPPLDNTCGP